MCVSCMCACAHAIECEIYLVIVSGLLVEELSGPCCEHSGPSDTLSYQPLS